MVDLKIIVFKKLISFSISWKWKWVTQSCPILCNLMDYTVHEILQTRIFLLIGKSEKSKC